MAFKKAFLAVFVLVTLFSAWPVMVVDARADQDVRAAPCHDVMPSSEQSEHLCQGQCGTACCHIVLTLPVLLEVPVSSFSHAMMKALQIMTHAPELLIRPPIV